jgi:hypothetical protein
VGETPGCFGVGLVGEETTLFILLDEIWPLLSCHSLKHFEHMLFVEGLPKNPQLLTQYGLLDFVLDIRITKKK